MAITIEIRPDRAILTTLNEQGQPVSDILNVAVTPATGSRQLHQYNLPEANSLNPATRLKNLFPGLKLHGTRELDTQHPADLIRQHRPQPAQGDHLIIHSPGEELRILQALAEQNLLKTFSQLTLQAHDEALYESAEPVSQTSQWLQAQGFESAGVNTDDPDWPIYEFCRNPLQDALDTVAREKKELQKQLKEQQAQVAALTEESRSLKQERDSERQARADLKQAEKALQERLDKAEAQQKAAESQTQELEARLKQVVAEKQQTESSLKAARTTNDTQIQKLQSQLEAATSQSAQHKQEAQRLQTELNTLAEENAGLQSTRQELADELQQVKGWLADRKAQLEKTQQALKEEQAAHQETDKALNDHRGWFQNRKQQAEQLKAELDELKQQYQQLQASSQAQKETAERLQAEVDRLNGVITAMTQEKQQLLDTQSSGQQALSQLEQKMEQLFNQQATQLQQTANALGRHVSQSFQDQRRQLQAFSGLTHYLETGEQALEYGGWAIGADLGQHLAKAIATGGYDLIIEFGSGSSTQLMARAVLNTLAAVRVQHTDNHKALSHKTGGKNAITTVHDDDLLNDLPQRILSFEQDHTYFQQTRSALDDSGLNNLVDLALAPLVPTTRTGQASGQALFYDCEPKLARVADLYQGRQARILVLVDGPYSPEGNPLAREPALAVLLQYLSAHHLDVILDDSKRPGEQQVAEHWQQLCSQRGLTCEQHPIQTEKGALWVTVQP